MQYISAVHVCRGSPPVISAIQSDNTIEARLGIDSHADISCAGKLARIIEVIEGETCTVHPFNDSMKPMKNVQTVKLLMLLRLMLVGPKIHVRFGTFVRVRVIFNGYRYFYIYIKKLRVC